ncbi:DUF7010 family protein [Allomuricauda sp. F6463D]|uniref:DUF7010 family protein n=1 Tax=Allomuricauda sp. F6463D TaxID=2926409 RepID=UPI001FF143FD|nr:hypothetical protein [Muricauda sp. F6463D]MCK0161214.1 hypothetical protein [Muricauda sp. F6463D]
MNKPENNPSIQDLNNISIAQSDLRKGYGDGAFGVLSSGFVWLVSSLVALLVSDQTAVWTLFFGGMLIHPLGLLLAKLTGVPGKHSNHNSLGKLVMEGTIFMLMCIPLALLLSLQEHAWFFQGMLLIIGGRYLTFTTLYGIKTYWGLGGILGAAAFALFFFNASPGISALTGAIVELGFSIVLFASFKKPKT